MTEQDTWWWDDFELSYGNNECNGRVYPKASNVEEARDPELNEVICHKCGDKQCLLLRPSSE